MFSEIFGDSAVARILDFLADHPDYDYSISEIARYSGISRPTIYKLIPFLVEKGLIIKTRKHAGSQMYKLNLENKLVQVILKFDFELATIVAETEAEEKENKKMKKTIIK